MENGSSEYQMRHSGERDEEQIEDKDGEEKT
jgi:hypothetical protein